MNTGERPVNKTAIADLLSKARYAVERACDQAGESRTFSLMVDSIEKAERRHQRSWKHEAKRSTLATRINYFVAHVCVVSERPPISSWTKAVSIRDDFRMGYALQELAGTQIAAELAREGVDLEALKAIDYAEHLA